LNTWRYTTLPRAEQAVSVTFSASATCSPASGQLYVPPGDWTDPPPWLLARSWPLLASRPRTGAVMGRVSRLVVPLPEEEEVGNSCPPEKKIKDRVIDTHTYISVYRHTCIHVYKYIYIYIWCRYRRRRKETAAHQRKEMDRRGSFYVQYIYIYIYIHIYIYI